MYLRRINLLDDCICIVGTGYTNGDDGVSSQTEASEDDIGRNKQPTDSLEVCRDGSSNNRLRPQTINCPQDPITETAEVGCLRLTKSHSGGDLTRARAGPGDRRSVPAMAPPSTAETTSRLFSPFPRQHFNKRRVDNAIRLGLYTVDDMTAAPHKTTSGRSARYPHS